MGNKPVCADTPSRNVAQGITLTHCLYCSLALVAYHGGHPLKWLTSESSLRIGNTVALCNLNPSVHHRQSVSGAGP
jgi:hypothetical protein